MKYIKLFETKNKPQLYFIPYSKKDIDIVFYIINNKINASKNYKNDIIDFLSSHDDEFESLFLEIGVDTLGNPGWNFAKIEKDDIKEDFQKKYYNNNQYTTLTLDEHEIEAMKYNL